MKKSDTVSKIKEDASLPSRDRFLAGYKNYGNYYVTLLCFIGASVAVSVGIALFSNVLLGLCLAIFSAIVYVICSVDEAKKQLGITCSHIMGRVHIKTAAAIYGDELVIPKRFELADVTHICDKAFADEKNSELTAVYLPETVTYIGVDIFGGRDVLPEIRFEGTEEQWAKIEKHTDLSCAVIVFGTVHPMPEKKKNERKPFSSENGGQTE